MTHYKDRCYITDEQIVAQELVESKMSFPVSSRQYVTVWDLEGPASLYVPMKRGRVGLLS